tara:strand:- start:1212 stop:1649 length:438 start_codon:yes stop_codon:yes gene_type:complete
MEDQDLDKYGFIDTSGQLIELASTFTTQATTGSISDSYLSTGDTHISTSGSVGLGATAPNTKLHINGNNIINGLGHGNNSSTYYNQGGADPYLLSKEQQLEGVKNSLNSVQNVLEELKDQVRSLTSSIEAENELKHERRKLGGDE